VVGDDLKPGDAVLRGLLYRWIPNTELSFDYKSGKPSKMAFRPDHEKGETGISVFRADLIGPREVIYGLDGYGVCEFTAEAFLQEVRRLRESRENRFDEEVRITCDPNAVPVKGHAHCYIDPMPAIIQKALYKRLATMTPGFLPGASVAGRSSREDSP
jgi:hypothetical protein